MTRSGSVSSGYKYLEDLCIHLVTNPLPTPSFTISAKFRDMERVVVHIGHRLFWFDVMVDADVPHRRLATVHQNQKHASRDIGLCQVFFRELMLPLPGWKMHNRNAIPMNATAEAARHESQVLSHRSRRRQCPFGISIQHDPVQRQAQFCPMEYSSCRSVCSWRRYAHAMVATLGAKARLIAASSYPPFRYCYRYYS
jgi:hypothetical protein